MDEFPSQTSNSGLTVSASNTAPLEEEADAIDLKAAALVFQNPRRETKSSRRSITEEMK
jgi:hypothetical protein